MSRLYIVATPIGNLSDISLRALEVFKSVDTILCEDTRVTGKLLKRYDISKPLVSYHQHSKVNKVNQIVELIKSGKDLALVSDAGTPGIQDPGSKLVNQLTGLIGELDLQIIPVPGASALTALASVSGLPVDSFLFLGFLPKKKGRSKLIKEIIESARTVVFYESGHRILKTLGELDNLISHSGAQRSGAIESRDPIGRSRSLQDDKKRQIVIGRELTKKFETIYRGTIEEVINQINKSSTKGEFVVVIEGK